MDLIQIDNVVKTYHLGEVDVPVLKGVSFTIKQGEMVALMGVSGSGKSTLMNILGLLDRPSTGKYWLNGQEVSRLSADKRATVRNRNIGFVFQSFNLLSRTSAVENVRMPLVYAVKQLSNRDERQRAIELLQRVGLGQRMDHEPSQLSGGQQQRVAVARSLVNNPPVLLADEPTGNLDSRTSEEILEMFQKLNQVAGITVIIVTHDLNVARHANRIIYIRDGLIDNDALARLTAAAPTNGHASENGSKTAASGEASGGGGVNRLAGLGAPSAPEVLGDKGSSPAAHQAMEVVEPFPASGGGAGRAAAAVAEPLVASNLTTTASVLTTPKPTRTAVRLVPRTMGTALHAIERNAFRSGLTTLGIVIGIAAVIAMMEIGQGSAAMIKQTMASMGANMLTIFPGIASSGGVSFGSGSTVTLTPDDATAIQKECPAVSGVAPLVRARTQVVYGNKNYVPMNIYGTTPQYLEIRDWTQMAQGAAFQDTDVRDGSAVCLLGQTIVDNLFPDESPIGKDVRMQNVAFRVVGVLERKGSNMLGMDQDDIVLAPWTTIKYRVSGSSLAQTNQASSSAASSSDPSQQAANNATTVNSLNKLFPSGGSSLYPGASTTEAADTPQPVRFVNVDQIIVQADTTEDIPLAIDQVTELLHERHHIGDGDNDDFNVRDNTEATNNMAKQSTVMSILLMIVAP